MSASQFPPVGAAPAEAVEKILATPGYNGIGAQAYGDVVIVWFQQPEDPKLAPTVWSGITPETAMQLGEYIARAGHAAESHQDVYGKKPIVIEQIVKRMQVRVTHLLRSEIINGTLDNPELTANRIIELMMKEMV